MENKSVVGREGETIKCYRCKIRLPVDCYPITITICSHTRTNFEFLKSLQGTVSCECRECVQQRNQNISRRIPQNSKLIENCEIKIYLTSETPMPVRNIIEKIVIFLKLEKEQLTSEDLCQLKEIGSLAHEFNISNYMKGVVVLFSKLTHVQRKRLIPRTSLGLSLLFESQSKSLGTTHYSSEKEVDWLKYSRPTLGNDVASIVDIKLLAFHHLSSAQTKASYRQVFLSEWFEGTISKIPMNEFFSFMLKKDSEDLTNSSKPGSRFTSRRNSHEETLKKIAEYSFCLSDLSKETSLLNRLNLLLITSNPVAQEGVALSIHACCSALGAGELLRTINFPEYIQQLLILYPSATWKTKSLLRACLFHEPHFHIFLKSICDSLIDMVENSEYENENDDQNETENGTANENAMENIIFSKNSLIIESCSFLLAYYLTQSRGSELIRQLSEIELLIEANNKQAVSDLIELTKYQVLKKSDDDKISLKDKQVIVLIGSSGSGKTSLALKLGPLYFGYGILTRVCPFLMNHKKLNRVSPISTFFRNFGRSEKRVAIIDGVLNLKGCYLLGEALEKYGARKSICFNLIVPREDLLKRLNKREIVQKSGLVEFQNEVTSLLEKRVNEWEEKNGKEVIYFMTQYSELFAIHIAKDEFNVVFETCRDIITNSTQELLLGIKCAENKYNESSREPLLVDDAFRFVGSESERKAVLEKLNDLQSTTIKHSMPMNILTPYLKQWVSNPDRYYVTRKTDGVRMWLLLINP
jgi:adenylate kinase family enzyme